MPLSTGPDTTYVSAHSKVCDRRLSRAARSLLLRHLRSAVPTSVDKHNVWQLLERLLSPDAYFKDQCPLIPLKDILRCHEEQSVVLLPPPQKATCRVGISIRSALYKQSKQAWQTHAWHQCGLCGKMFSSKFYLDQHLDNHHASTINSVACGTAGFGRENGSEIDFICPATTWCSALPSCNQQALELEPFYGPGSGGLGEYDRYIAHRSLLWSEVDEVREGERACDEEEMQAKKYRCQRMIMQCFSSSSTDDTRAYEHSQGDLHRLLEQSLCNSISCPGRLHRLFIAGTDKSSRAASVVIKRAHEWQGDWKGYYDEHHRMGCMGFFLLLLLGIWYGSCLWQTCRCGCDPRWLLHSRRRRGNRLLQRSAKRSKANEWLSIIYGVGRKDSMSFKEKQR